MGGKHNHGKARLPELTATHSALSQLRSGMGSLAMSLSGFAERSIMNRARNTTTRINRSKTRTMRTISSRVRLLLLNLIFCSLTSIGSLEVALAFAGYIMTPSAK